MKAEQERLLTPSRKYDFITDKSGKIYLSRPNTNSDFSIHLGLSGGQDVRFAGGIRFYDNQGASKGKVKSWSNDSGHYKPNALQNHQAGLPLDLFEKFKKR